MDASYVAHTDQFECIHTNCHVGCVCQLVQLYTNFNVYLGQVKRHIHVVCIYSQL